MQQDTATCWSSMPSQADTLEAWLRLALPGYAALPLNIEADDS